MQIFMSKRSKVFYPCTRPRNRLKMHLNNCLMLKVRLIYLELLGFISIEQSPCLVKSFIMFSFLVVIQYIFLMICLLNLFCCLGYLLCIVFTKAQKRRPRQWIKKVHPSQREVCCNRGTSFLFSFIFLPSLWT